MWVSIITGTIDKVHSIVRVNIDDSCNNLKIEIIAVYNPNANNARDFLDDIEALLDTSTVRNCVVGDFNIDALKHFVLLERELGCSLTDHNWLVFDVDRGDLFTDQSKMKPKHISMIKINYNKNLLLENKSFVIDGGNVGDQCDKFINYLKENINEVKYTQFH
ncbi:hypothetical protein PR048_005307 [Dryococelus australis]|uniref:Endonuclease/exonuclease/phosphatase domain-containing protein n=1 Tax=Dryococelus australis TaxID=614101 RepID=A0ABQ9I7W9_9NEOP|nr:hypothetical protein PR048_005307 [Dryococelus australis]